MKVSELTGNLVIEYARIDVDASDRTLIDALFLPAAKARVRSETGLTDKEMDKYEDLTIAVCSLCAHFYDNRSVAADTEKENKVVREILGAYCGTLIPGGGAS